MTTTVNNLPTNKNQQNTTDEYFNNYFTVMPNVSVEVDRELILFFEDFTGNKEAANVLAGSIIMTAKTQNLDLRKIIAELKTLEKDKINVYLTLLLNMNRVNTSLLGVINTPAVSHYVSRTVRP